jgi:hypothetical protein
MALLSPKPLFLLLSPLMNAAATVLQKHTYTLGRSLYIPLTCRCNSIPLPLTRGPGFMLPKSIIDALISVRNEECGVEFVPSPEERGGLPDYSKNWLVNTLYPDDMINDHSPENETYNGKYVLDDRINPSIKSLAHEAVTLLSSNSHNEQPVDQIVIAGEGEPTLRMDALLSISHQIQSHQKSNNAPPLPIRLITNGLVYTIPNFGYSPSNINRYGMQIHRHSVLRDMLEAGISRVSVALNTANRHEYDVLMEPCSFTSGSLMPGMAHDMICEFILEACKVGMEVEITGIDRRDVDKSEVDRLARMLLSVAERNKRSNVRWRGYFE